MMYHSPSTIVRNLDALKDRYRIIQTGPVFRIAQFPHPGFAGYEFWVVNVKGFLWEGFADQSGAEAFIADPANTEEALAA